MKNKFKQIINEIDVNLTKYNQRNKYKKELLLLKEKTSKDNLINEIKYEVNILSFTIRKDKLIPLNSVGDWNYPNIKDFDENFKNYLKYRFENTPNEILKNMYLIILFHLNLDIEEIHQYIDSSLNIINNYLIMKKDIELTNDLIFTIFDKCMSFNYKKDKIKEIIIKYVKSDFNDKYSIKQLIELMLSKKKVFKKENFEGIDRICWSYANESESVVIIEFLEIGKKISQKLQKNLTKWDNKLGETYEDFAYGREDSKFIQNDFLSESLNYYKKANNHKKVEEISIKLKKIHKNYELTRIPLPIPLEEIYNYLLTEIYGKIPLEHNSFMEYIINDFNELLIPKLEKNDNNYENFKQNAPLLASLPQIKLDNNHNITQKISKEEDKIKDSNYSQYSFYIMIQKIYLKELFIYAYQLKIFTSNTVLNYLSICQKFLNMQNSRKHLLYYFEPIIKEYFKQFELSMFNKESNYVLFIDSIVSKIELLIRILCEIYNVEMIKPQGKNTTSEKLLHDFFNDSKFKKILLEKDYDFLKYILLNPGLNLRNKSAHGIDLKIYNFDNATLLLLCFFRLLKYFIIIDNEYFTESNLFES